MCIILLYIFIDEKRISKAIKFYDVIVQFIVFKIQMP